MKLRLFECSVCQEPTKAKYGSARSAYGMCPSCFREKRHEERMEEGIERAERDGNPVPP